jgi:copper chaperone CopZ
MKTETLKITGMTREDCTKKIAHKLKSIHGVHDIAVSLKNHEATVHYDEQLTSPAKLKLAIHEAGYDIDTKIVIRGETTTVSEQQLHI